MKTVFKANPKQSAAFIAKAREIEADGDGSLADVLIGRLAKMKPAPHTEKKKAVRRGKK